jgi:phage shock protein C
MNRLYRSYDDRVIAGVAGGMAETYNIDPALVRIGWVVLALLTGGVILIVYIVMALVVPMAPDDVPAAGWPGGQWPSSAHGQPSQISEETQMNDTTQPTPAATGGPAAPGPFVSERELRRQRRAEQRETGGTDIAGPLVFGLLLIGVGAYFLLREYLPAIAWGQLWPILLIGLGVVLLLGAFRRGAR